MNNVPYDQMKAFEAWMEQEGLTWEVVMDFETWGQVQHVRDMTDKDLFEFLRYDQVVMDIEVVWDFVSAKSPDELEEYKQYLLDFWSSQRSVGEGQA